MKTCRHSDDIYRERILASGYDLATDYGCGSRSIPGRQGLLTTGIDTDRDALYENFDIWDHCLSTISGTLFPMRLGCSHSVLEHMTEPEKLIEALNGHDHFVLCFPCRNSLISRVNVLLPDAWAEWIIRAWKHRRRHKAYYRLCTPGDMRRMLGNVQVAACWNYAGYAPRVLWPVVHAFDWLCSKVLPEDYCTHVVVWR